MKEFLFVFVIHDYERGDFTLLFFTQVMRPERSNVFVSANHFPFI